MRKKHFIVLINIIIIVCILLQLPILNDNYLSYLLILPGLLLGFIVSVIIHELGHLVFGLISGYKFTSFKALFIKVYKTDKIKIKFETVMLAIPGQCLMKPTSRKYLLYNLGGLIFTYILSIVLIISFYILNNVYISQLLFGMFFVNSLLGILNSIYNENGVNDICNIIRCKNNKDFLEGVLYQLDIYSNLSSKNKFKSNYQPSDDVKNIYSNVAIWRFKYFKALNENNNGKMEYYYNLLKRNCSNIPLYFLKLSILLLVLNHEFMFKNDIKLLRRSLKINKKDEELFKKLKEEYRVYLLYKEIILEQTEYNCLVLEKLIINKPSDMLERLHNKMYLKLNRVFVAYVNNGYKFD